MRPNRVSMADFHFQRAPLKREDDPQFWDGHHAAIAKRAEALTAQRVENWPQSRQLAILMIARTDLGLKCIAALSGSNVRARQHDFAALRNHGYATKNLADRYHKLTKDGWKAAETAAWMLARELGIHHLRCHFDSWSEHTGRCPCGWTASVNRRSNTNWRERLEREFDKHLANPNEWKQRVVTVQEIIDKVGTGTLALFRNKGT